MDPTTSDGLESADVRDAWAVLNPEERLEGFRLLLESNRALWSGLAHLAVGPADAADRAHRAEELLATSESLRLVALHTATRGGFVSPSAS